MAASVPGLWKLNTERLLGIEAIRESRFHAGALVEKRQRARMRGKISRQALAILGGLHFDTDQGKAFFLGFNYSSRFAIDIEQIIRKPVTAGQWEVS
jgi:hypothetical protein